MRSKNTRIESRQSKLMGSYFSDNFNTYRDLHAHALFSSLGRLVASPFTSIMTIAVLAISISLASIFYVLVNNLQQLTGNIENSQQISLFLKDSVNETQANKLLSTIKQNPSIKETKLITKEQALNEFKIYSGFGHALDALEKNPLPIVIQVLPKDSLESPQNSEEVVNQLKNFAEVEFAQIDMQWIERLHSILDVAKRVGHLLNGILGFAVVFITGNTIRLELQTRHDEVVILTLFGATRSFIQRPFLYSGFWLGFISGISAWFIITIMMLFIRESVEHLSTLYQSSFHLLFLTVSETIGLISISSLLGIAGSWAVITYQLRQLKSE